MENPWDSTDRKHALRPLKVFSFLRKIKIKIYRSRSGRSFPNWLYYQFIKRKSVLGHSWYLSKQMQIVCSTLIYFILGFLATKIHGSMDGLNSDQRLLLCQISLSSLNSGSIDSISSLTTETFNDEVAQQIKDRNRVNLKKSNKFQRGRPGGIHPKKVWKSSKRGNF